MQANKGEWSELYALFAIFANHKVPAADKNLDPIGDEYEFLQVLREDVPGNGEYFIKLNLQIRFIR